jgi:hypothetical protein
MSKENIKVLLQYWFLAKKLSNEHRIKLISQHDLTLELEKFWLLLVNTKSWIQLWIVANFWRDIEIDEFVSEFIPDVIHHERDENFKNSMTTMFASGMSKEDIMYLNIVSQFT